MFTQPQLSPFGVCDGEVCVEWFSRQSYYRLKFEHDYKKAQKHLLLLYANQHIEYAVVVVYNLFLLPCNGMVDERESLNKFTFNDIKIIIIIRCHCLDKVILTSPF